eukprot:3663134-Rhodomonas_salina.1
MGLGGSSEEQDTAALGGAEGRQHSMSVPEAAAEADDEGARGGRTKPELSGEGSGATAQQLPPPPPPPAGSEARCSRDEAGRGEREALTRRGEQRRGGRRAVGGPGGGGGGGGSGELAAAGQSHVL